MNSDGLHIAVIGTGAIGGVLAACLSRAGHRVTPITGNAAIADALRTHGYRVRELDGRTWSTPTTAAPLVAATDGDRAHQPYDLCIVATQSTRLEAALESILPSLSPSAPVVCCQNGLPEERAGKLVGLGRVLGCVVGWGASMIEPGLYLRTSLGGLQLGLPASVSPSARADAEAVRRLLEAASPVHLVDDFAGVRWSKLAINCCTTTLGAIGGAPLGPLLRHRFARRLALEVFAEVSAVARSAGIKPAPVGGTLDIDHVAITAKERALRFGSPSLAYKHSILLAVGIKYRRMRSSMLYALERGRPPEIDFLNGELVRRGQALGVPTPVNRFLVEEIGRIVQGQSSPGVATLRALHERYASTPAPPA